MITINNRDTLEWKPGLTVQNILETLNYVYSMIVVTVDGKLVDEDEYETFEVRDNASVRMIHIHHGG
jgi:thiamine biosynthesis protein ThiS